MVVHCEHKHTEVLVKALCLRGFWENADHSFPASAFSMFSFKAEIRSCTLIPLFMPGSAHSGSANWYDSQNWQLNSIKQTKTTTTTTKSRGWHQLADHWKSDCVHVCNIQPCAKSHWFCQTYVKQSYLIWTKRSVLPSWTLPDGKLKEKKKSK